MRALFDNWFYWSRASELPGGCFFIPASSEVDDQPGPLRDVLLASHKDWLGVLGQAARVLLYRDDLESTRLARLRGIGENETPLRVHRTP